MLILERHKEERVKPKMKSKVIFHSFINSDQKKELFEKASTLIFPTRYKKESFGLVVVKAFSYGIPVRTTDEGSLKSIVNEKSGIVVSNLENLPNAFENILGNFVNKETAKYCRQRYLNNFSLEQFENNLVSLFK